jgi:SAM-dependent methyltransferase
MERFRDHYLRDLASAPLSILDFGSANIYGCYRPLFAQPNWRYTGVDLALGPNVDLVLKQPYHWREIPTHSVDVFISGQVLEHVACFWISLLEISRVLKPGGLCCIVVPSAGPEHRYPLDCWRFYPDGMKSLANFARLHALEIYTQWQGIGDEEPWNDSVLVAQKPRRSFLKQWGVTCLQALQRRSMTCALIHDTP